MLIRTAEGHFNAEQTVMEQLNFRNLKNHTGEHRKMLDKLARIGSGVENQEWRPNDILEFINLLQGHMLQADRALNAYLQEREPDRIPA